MGWAMSKNTNAPEQRGIQGAIESSQTNDSKIRKNTKLHMDAESREAA